MDYDSLEENVGDPGKWGKRKLSPYMPVFHLYMFFDDFLRTGEKRKVKYFGWDSLEKNVGDPGIWGKRKNMPIYARISLCK